MESTPTNNPQSQPARRPPATGSRVPRAKATAGNAPAAALPASSRDFAAGEDRYRLIAEAAYFRAERRGFAPGRELDDWLLAEIEVDEMLGSAERA